MANKGKRYNKEFKDSVIRMIKEDCRRGLSRTGYTKILSYLIEFISQGTILWLITIDE